MQSTRIHSSLWTSQHGCLIPPLFSITTSITAFSCLPQTIIQDQRQHSLFITSWARQLSQSISTFVTFPLSLSLFQIFFKVDRPALYSHNTVSLLRKMFLWEALAWHTQCRDHGSCVAEIESLVPKTPFPSLATKQPQWGLKISTACFSCCKTGGSKTTKKTTQHQAT